MRLAVVCAVLVLFLAAASVAEARAPVRPCRVTGDLVRLDVRGASCPGGRRVAAAWVRARRSCDPPVPFIARTCTVRRWRCRATRTAISVTRRVRCSRGAGRIAFRHGRDPTLESVL